MNDHLSMQKIRYRDKMAWYEKELYYKKLHWFKSKGINKRAQSRAKRSGVKKIDESFGN